jgi:hypothetical protein
VARVLGNAVRLRPERQHQRRTLVRARHARQLCGTAVALDAHLSTGAQVAGHGPMQCRWVLAASLQNASPQSPMQGATDWLIGRAGRGCNARVSRLHGPRGSRYGHVGSVSWDQRSEGRRPVATPALPSSVALPPTRIVAAPTPSPCHSAYSCSPTSPQLKVVVQCVPPPPVPPLPVPKI